MFTSFSLIGLFRHLRHKIFGHEVIISGKCINCGACCKDLCLDFEGTWLSSEKKFKELVAENSAYDRFVITGRDNDNCLHFDCNKLTKENTCGDYANRLNICKTFPDQEMFYMKGKLPSTCGYSMTQGESFEKILNKKKKQKLKPFDMET